MFVIANVRPFGYNIGNSAINFALRNMIYETFGRLVSIIEIPASSAHEITTNAGLTKKTVYEINRYADGVIVGGGNLYENDEIDIDSVSLSNLLPPLMLFSNSRGRIYSRNLKLKDRSDVISDVKLMNLLKASDISLSRDTATVEYAKKLGFEDQIGYCPTINIKNYIDRIPNLMKNEYCGALISIRTPNLMNIPVKCQAKVTGDISAFIDTLFQNGHKRVRILCNDTRDLDFAQQFKGTRSIDTLFTNDVYEYLSVLQNASMIVSYRLHATLPAISMGTPVINITYDERAHCLSSDLNIESASSNMITNINFRSDVCKKIATGGYTAANHKKVKKFWDQIGKDQFKQFKKFKSLVSRYVKANRLVNI